MKMLVATFLAAAVANAALAYNVSVGTYVVNEGHHVTIPVMIDDVAGLSYAEATITYNPQVLIVTKAEAGSLRSVMSDDFVAADTNGTVAVAIYSDGNVAEGSGSIANITFAVRDGTAGQYSDVAVTKVSLGEITGVKDVTYGKELETVNGMVRVMGSSAQVSRLDGPEIICADTHIGSLELEVGDAIQASDSQTAIRVAGDVVAKGPINVVAPVNGWASGRYALISTRTTGLTFAGVVGEVTSEAVGDVTTYYATVAVAGEIPVVPDNDSEHLTAGDMNLIRQNARLAFEGKMDEDSLAMKTAYESASSIKIAGPSGLVGIIADMGIAPAFAPTLDETGTLKLTYATPTLAITAFDPMTGAVRFKVTPGEGNQIVSEIATGYIHVYGTDNLGEKMRYVSSVGFDLTPYLKADTKGEGVLNITLGTHTFLKVKIESESRTEGDEE